MTTVLEAAPARGSAEAGERVVLVDAHDREIGTAEKMRAHRECLLHRAVSVFLFDSRGEVLLQRRAAGKYHSGGLWSNACCSHPRPGEPVADAARRRLREELGLDCALRHAHAFTYAAAVGPELWEHEYDHVFVGVTDADPEPDPAEVSEWRRAPVELLLRELAATPHDFTPWLVPALAGALRG